MLINQCLHTVGKIPLTKEKLRRKHYSQQKIEQITTVMQKLMFSKPQSSRDDGEIIQKLKWKFSSASTSKREKN